MTLGEFRQLTAHEPDSMDMFVQQDTTGKEHDFEYNLVENAFIKDLSFSEEPNGKKLAREKVLVITDEINIE